MADDRFTELLRPLGAAVRVAVALLKKPTPQAVVGSTRSLEMALLHLENVRDFLQKQEHPAGAAVLAELDALLRQVFQISVLLQQATDFYSAGRSWGCLTGGYTVLGAPAATGTYERISLEGF